MPNFQPGRTARVAGALIAVVTLMTALFAVTSVASNADVPATGVTTVATTPYQSGINPNTTTLTGLKDGDNIAVNISAPVVFGADARLCRSGLSISLQAQFNPSPAGNCLASPLPGGGTGPVIGTSFGPTNTGGTLNFVVGTGSDAAIAGGHVGNGAAIVCDVNNPCDLWIKISVPTTVLASGQSYVHYGLTFSGPPNAPATPTATAGNGQVAVSAAPDVNTGNAALTQETFTASPGGATCVATSPATGCTVTGLSNFTAYTFTATTTNAAGFTSAASGPSAAATPLPGAPGITGTNPGNASVQVTWSAATPAPTNYTVTSTPGSLTCTTASLTCTVTGLTNGTPYTFVVTANYGAGTVSSVPSGTVTPTGQFVTQTFTVTRPAGALLIGENCSTTAGTPGGAGYNLGTVPQNCNLSFGTAVLNANATYYTASTPIDAVKVLDTRDTDVGWTVTGSMTPFASGANSFAPCNFGLVPTAVGEGGPAGYTQTTSAGAAIAPNCTPTTAAYGTSNLVAQANALGGLGYSDITGVASVQIPVSAPSGTYTAVLTFTLLSK